MDAADVVKPACPPFGPELHSCLEEHSLKGEDKQQHRERESAREKQTGRERFPPYFPFHTLIYLFSLLSTSIYFNSATHLT